MHSLLRSLATPLAIAAVLTLAVAPDAAAQDESWQFDLAVYGWLPSLDAKLAFDIPETGGDVEVDGQTFLDNLQFVAMSSFAARYGRWTVLADVIYLEESAGKERLLDLGDGVQIESTLDLQMWSLTLGGSCDLARDGRSFHAVLLGARSLSMDTTLSMAAGGPLETDRSIDSSVRVYNAVTGLRGRFGLGDHWFVPYYFDIGAGDSNLTWQSYAGIGYEFKWGAVVATYRYLDFDQGQDSSVQDLSLAGGELGFIFRF